MNNGLISLFYMYLLCSGGRQPWRRILLYGPPGTGDHFQSNLRETLPVKQSPSMKWSPIKFLQFVFHIYSEIFDLY